MKNILKSVVYQSFSQSSRRFKRWVIGIAIAAVLVVGGTVAVAGYAIWSVGTYASGQIKNLSTQAGGADWGNYLGSLSERFDMAGCQKAFAQTLTLGFWLKQPLETSWQSIKDGCLKQKSKEGVIEL